MRLELEPAWAQPIVESPQIVTQHFHTSIDTKSLELQKRIFALEEEVKRLSPKKATKYERYQDA
ncbi:hypothetical protein LCGC14_2175000, partial [marine sediment metagenome]